MRVTRRAALSGITVGSLGLVVRAEEALEPGLCAGKAVGGFDPFCFTDSLKRRHQVYVANGGGPPVMVLHELPGLTDADLCTATQLAKQGFTVVAPLLFGEAGGPGRGLWPAFSECGNDEFSCNSGERTSPVVPWLRELAVDVNRQWPKGTGVGVIGMCLTGAFPLAMLREQVVVAPVLCQPTLPFSPWNLTARFGWFTDKDALAISVDDLRHARERREVPILGLRYKGDWRCRQERFDRLQKEFGTRFDPLVLEGSHHSTLGGDFCDLAFQRVVTFLKKQLYPRASLIDEPPAAAVAGAACPTKPAPCATASHHGSME